MEAQLARLDKEAEAAGIATNLRHIVRMFRDYSATLDEAIKLAPERMACCAFNSDSTLRITVTACHKRLALVLLLKISVYGGLLKSS